MNRDKLKQSLIWKLSKPLRSTIHFFIRCYQRLRFSINSYFQTKKNRRLDAIARKQHGLASFPDENERIAEREYKFSKAVKFSILVPLYNTPEKFLREMIDSVRNQTYENWELCLADGSDSEHDSVRTICMEYDDERIVYKKLERNTGISGNTNECLKLATGDYIGLLDHDDLLHPSVLYYYMKEIDKINADYIYCDECTFEGDSIDNMITLHFKPDYAPDNLKANNYITHFSVFSRMLMEKCLAGEKDDSGNPCLFRKVCDGAQDHDLALRLTKIADKVGHVQKILYYWRYHEGSTSADLSVKSYAIDGAKKAVLSALEREGFSNCQVESTKAFETIFRIKYPVDATKLVTILILNKNHYEDLKRLMDSIFEKTSFPNYEIIIIDNNSEEEAVIRYYEELAKKKVSILSAGKCFNYAAFCNMGVKAAKGEYIVFLDNDCQVITNEWLEELLMYASQREIGAVGCKLYYKDYTVQHAGFILGMGAEGLFGRAHYHFPKTNIGYMGRLCFNQNMSAVSGSCMMVEKGKFLEAGGMDESFAYGYADVDLCLRLTEKGYRNVWTPYAELFHYEAATLKEEAQSFTKEKNIFREKWGNLISKGDPYYNCNLSYDNGDYALRIFSHD